MTLKSHAFIPSSYLSCLQSRREASYFLNEKLWNQNQDVRFQPPMIYTTEVQARLHERGEIRDRESKTQGRNLFSNRDCVLIATIFVSLLHSWVGDGFLGCRAGASQNTYGLSQETKRLRLYFLLPLCHSLLTYSKWEASGLVSPVGLQSDTQGFRLWFTATPTPRFRTFHLSPNVFSAEQPVWAAQQESALLHRPDYQTNVFLKSTFDVLSRYCVCWLAKFQKHFLCQH